MFAEGERHALDAHLAFLAGPGDAHHHRGRLSVEAIDDLWQPDFRAGFAGTHFFESVTVGKEMRVAAAVLRPADDQRQWMAGVIEVLPGLRG